MASEHGMTIEARSATYADAGMGGTAGEKVRVLETAP